MFPIFNDPFFGKESRGKIQLWKGSMKVQLDRVCKKGGVKTVEYVAFKTAVWE